MSKFAIPFIILLAAALITPTARGAEHTVDIDDLKYSPKQIKIEPGDTVVWKNNDDRDHTVKGEAKDFSSGKIAPGKSYSYKFPNAGEFEYHCDYHPRMKGTVVVRKKK